MPLDLLDYQRDFAAAIDRPAAGPMAVYRNTVLHGSVEALRANYPVVEQLVGVDMFGHAAADHAAHFPPRSPVLALYGSQFPDWLEAQDWAADLPYLADVARLERLRTETLFAADGAALQDRTDRAWQDWRPALHPAARFGWFTSPAWTVWNAHQHAFDGDLELDWRAEGVLFTRPSPFDLRAAPLCPAAHRLLSGMRLGESLPAAMHAAIRLYPETAADTLFASLVTAGAFAAPIDERTCP